MFPLGNAARATRWVSLGIGAISCGWSDIAILLGSKDGDQTPSLQTLLASGLCEITLRCLMMPHEIGIGPRLMSCKSEFASSILAGHPQIARVLHRDEGAEAVARPAGGDGQGRRRGDLPASAPVRSGQHVRGVAHAFGELRQELEQAFARHRPWRYRSETPPRRQHRIEGTAPQPAVAFR